MGWPSFMPSRRRNGMPQLISGGPGSINGQRAVQCMRTCALCGYSVFLGKTPNTMNDKIKAVPIDSLGLDAKDATDAAYYPPYAS